MIEKVWRVVLVLGLVLPWVMVPREASACSCNGPGEVDAEFRRVSAVFDGTVTAVTRPGDFAHEMQQRLSQVPLLGIQEPKSVATARVRVHRSWKGVEYQTITLSPDLSDGVNCGFGFDVGTRAIFYARGSGSEFGTSFCGRTVSVSNAAEDLAYLQTQPMLTLSLTPQELALRVGLIGLGVVLVLGMGGYVWIQRHKETEAQ